MPGCSKFRTSLTVSILKFFFKTYLLKRLQIDNGAPFLVWFWNAEHLGIKSRILLGLFLGYFPHGPLGNQILDLLPNHLHLCWRQLCSLVPLWSSQGRSLVLEHNLVPILDQGMNLGAGTKMAPDSLKPPEPVSWFQTHLKNLRFKQNSNRQSLQTRDT